MRLLSRIAAACFLAAVALSPIAALAASTPGVQGDAVITFNGKLYGAAGVTQPNAPIDITKLFQFSQGTSTGQADRIYVAERTIAASSSENLDLAGVLTDPLGTTLTFAKVKAIIVIANAANTNDVVLGGASSTFVGFFGGTNPAIAIPPGGAIMIANPGAGWAVTASSSDLLKVANSSSGTGVTYRVIIIGTSA